MRRERHYHLGSESSPADRSTMAHHAVVFLLVGACMLIHHTRSQCLTDNYTATFNSVANENNRLALLRGQLQFSIDLLQTIGGMQDSDNVFFSPSSVYNALLLAYFASANHTEASLKQTLQLPEDQDKLATLGAFSTEKYYQKLRSIKGPPNYLLHNANRMYISKEQEVLPCMKQLFKEEIEKVDFGKNVSDTIMKINNWVSIQTREKINDLLSPDALNSNTNLVLVNAAYFQGIWKNQFSPSDTREMKFTLANGTRVSTMMMALESKFSHRILENLGAEVLELQYEGDDISMFILLPLNPSATAITDLINKTDIQIIQDIVDKSSSFIGDLSIIIPKFSVDQSLEMTPVLESLGVGDLFQDTADLSSLTGAPTLKLDSAIHKAKITVDETGTVAAAATAIFANRFAADSFIANHPFVYFIFNKKANILLFVGIYNSP